MLTYEQARLAFEKLLKMQKQFGNLFSGWLVGWLVDGLVG